MAWTQTDLDNVEAAIVSNAGVSRIRFADGREVEYTDKGGLLKVRDAIKSSLSSASGKIMATFASFNKD